MMKSLLNLSAQQGSPPLTGTAAARGQEHYRDKGQEEGMNSPLAEPMIAESLRTYIDS